MRENFPIATDLPPAQPQQETKYMKEIKYEVKVVIAKKSFTHALTRQRIVYIVGTPSVREQVNFEQTHELCYKQVSERTASDRLAGYSPAAIKGEEEDLENSQSTLKRSTCSY